jgi:phosphate binding protein
MLHTCEEKNMLYNRRIGMKLVGLAMLLALALPMTGVLAQGGDEAEPIVLPEVDPLSVTGDIAIAGSSTVEPVTVAMAARFKDDGFMGTIDVAETGTGAGFERFCKEGSTDISNASRKIQQAEIDNCVAIDREVVEFRVGTDALTIAVNKDNTFVTQLKRSEALAIFTGEVTMWNEVNPDWPAEKIALFTPGTDSGTFDFFGEAILGTKGPYTEKEARTSALLAADPTVSENDNTLVEGIAGSEYAIGYFGFAYYIANQDKLNAVAVANDMKNDDNGDLVVISEVEWNADPEKPIDYVAPSGETAENNTYMLSRPLFIYSAKSVMAEKPQVAAYINYYLTNANDVVSEVGYFPASVEALNQAKQNWLDATGM